MLWRTHVHIMFSSLVAMHSIISIGFIHVEAKVSDAYYSRLGL
jgi:hypothetical protein